MSARAIISPKQARLEGRKHYFTGAPCKHGHVAERLTSCGVCVECSAGRDRNYAKAGAKAYYWANRERRLAQNSEWHKRQADHVRQSKAAWRALNREAVNLYARARRAKIASSDGHHTAADIADIGRLQRGRCAYCRALLHAPQVDHIVPLARGGANSRRNLQLTCKTCNSSKRAKDPITFAQQRGMLL